MFNVNKLNFIYFTWLVYTFDNCKYNVLLKRDHVCLIPLSTLVTLVGERRCPNVGNWRWHNSHFRPCHNVVTTSTTTLWQRCHNVAVPAGFMSSCTNRNGVFNNLFALICTQLRDKQNFNRHFLLFKYFLNNLLWFIFMRNTVSKLIELFQ